MPRRLPWFGHGRVGRMSCSSPGCPTNFLQKPKRCHLDISFAYVAKTRRKWWCSRSCNFDSKKCRMGTEWIMMLLSASSRLRTSDELSFILRQQARKAFQELQAAVEDLAAACNDEEALDVNLSAKILEHKSLSRGECFLWSFWMHFYFCLTFFHWCRCTTPQLPLVCQFASVWNNMKHVLGIQSALLLPLACWNASAVAVFFTNFKLQEDHWNDSHWRIN